MNGQQGDDAARLAGALIQLSGQDEPPLQFPAGADAVATLEQKAQTLLAQAGAYSDLSGDLAHDDACSHHPPEPARHRTMRRSPRSAPATAARGMRHLGSRPAGSVPPGHLEAPA